MKILNNTISNLGILPDLEIPKKGSAEVSSEQMELASKSPVVAAWFKEGHLSFEDEAAALAEKEAADKKAAEEAAALAEKEAAAKKAEEAAIAAQKAADEAAAQKSATKNGK